MTSFAIAGFVGEGVSGVDLSASPCVQCCCTMPSRRSYPMRTFAAVLTILLLNIFAWAETPASQPASSPAATPNEKRELLAELGSIQRGKPEDGSFFKKARSFFNG
jgi:hypothetical protein